MRSVAGSGVPCGEVEVWEVEKGRRVARALCRVEARMQGRDEMGWDAGVVPQENETEEVGKCWRCELRRWS